MPARLIYLLGTDGSGKTTVAAHIVQIFRAKNRTVQCVWATLRPVILWPIIKVAKFLFVRKHNKFDNYQEHIKVKGEALQRFSFFFKPLFYLSLLDYYPQYLWKVVRMSWKNDYLICDRYYIDLIIDRAILEGAGLERVTDWLHWYGRFFRSPDLVFYLRTSPEVAIQRKTDIPSEEYLQERGRYYDFLTELLRAHVIDGDQPLQTVLARVQECIDDLDRRLGSLPR
jgi:thymidylate kinase